MITTKFCIGDMVLCGSQQLPLTGTIISIHIDAAGIKYNISLKESGRIMEFDEKEIHYTIKRSYSMVHEFVRQWVTIHMTGSDSFSSESTFREVDQSVDSLNLVELTRDLEEHLDVDLDATGISPDIAILDYVKLIHDEYVTAG